MATEVATLTLKADTSDLTRAETALDGVTQSGKKTASAIEKLAKENRDLSVSARETKKQIEALNKEARESQARFNSLEKEFKQVKAANDSLSASLKNAKNENENFSNSSKKTSDSVRKLRSTAGQLGFQVQDIAVQLQSGTNAMIVFGQQGSQIAGAFGPGGAIVGAVIAVGAAVGTALVAHFSNGTEAAKDFKKEIDELTEGFDKLGDAARTVAIRETFEDIEKAEEKIQKTRVALEEANKALRDPAALEAANMLNPYVDLLVEARIKQQNLALAEERQAAALEALQKKYDLIIGVRKEEDKDAKRRLEDITRYVERLKEQAATLGLNTIELARYKAVQMGANAEQLKSIMLSAEAIKKYQEEVEAAKLLAATKKRNEAEDKARTKAREADQSNLDRWFANFYKAEGKKADAEQASIDQRAVQIAESLMSEEEQIRLSYERRSQTILDSTLLTGQQVNEAMAALELERQDKLRAIKDKSAAEDRERAAQTTTQLLAFEDVLMKGKSEKQKTAYRLAVNLASAEKRQNAAKIVSDSYAAAMGAYKALAGIPIIGPALGAGAAALILGAGVSYAAKSLTGRALGGQVRDGESYVVGERGPEVLTMNGGGGRIIPNDKLRGDSGKTINQQANVTFQISTVDAESFDDLLDSRRGQIINMINTALNESGKGALA